MDVYRTEEEQVAAIRQWWKDNGTAVIIAVVLAIGSYAGWKWYQHARLEAQIEASTLYQGMMESYQAIVAGDPGAADAQQRIVKAGEELIGKHGDTAYAQLAGLMLAGDAVERDDYAAAEKYLRGVLERADDVGLATVAGHRLARVVSAQGRHDEALALVAEEAPEKFRSARADVRGDILLAQGKRAEARAAWQQALDLAAAEDPARVLVQMKLDYVAGE